MPNFTREKKIDLKGALGKKKAKEKEGADASEQEEKPRPKRDSAQPSRVKPATSIFDEDDGDEEEDEIIVEAKGDKGLLAAILTPKGIALCAVPVVLLLAFVFFMRTRSGNPTPPDSVDTPSQAVASQPPAPPSVEPTLSVGLQDFTGNTNNTSDSAPEDPALFTHDLYGLTTQVNYEVASIKEAADFVNYKKHRGVWDSGLELYWLEATYREKQYVIQVPFKYYKELDDVGIVPVKMEVLQIKVDDSILTVISYMTLDEATLKSIMKTQSK